METCSFINTFNGEPMFQLNMNNFRVWYGLKFAPKGKQTSGYFVMEILKNYGYT